MVMEKLTVMSSQHFNMNLHIYIVIYNVMYVLICFVIA